VLLPSNVVRPPVAVPGQLSLTDGAESKSADMTFFAARKTIVDEKISFNVSLPRL
jgi:hypothetical protein